MTTTAHETTFDANRIVDSFRDAEQSVLDAVRRFVDAVDDVFPDVGEDGPRRKIIDSAFKMTEQLLGASNDLAKRMLNVSTETSVRPKRARASK